MPQPIASPVTLDNAQSLSGTPKMAAQNVNFFYGSSQALFDVSLTFPERQVTALIGPSGCGKSTFLRCLNRMNDLIPGTRTEGLITLDKEDINAPNFDVVNLRRRVGMVFQKPTPFPKTIFENVAYGLHRRKLPAKDRQTRVEYALNMVGLSDFSQAYPASLSGGMCQRVALARALVLRPDILLLDEPFASLDAVTRIRLQDELLQLWECHGWTVILVTHNLDEAVYMADRVALLYPPPQGLKRVLTVDIPRTRSRNNAKVKEISGRLAQDLGADACNLQLEENPDA